MATPYNLSANLVLNEINASVALRKLEAQLSSARFSIPITLQMATAQRELAALRASAAKPINVKVNVVGLNQAVTHQNQLANAFVATHSAIINTRREMSTYVRDIATLSGSLLSLHRALVLVEQGIKHVTQVQKLQVGLGQATGERISGPTVQSITKATQQTAKKMGASSTALLGSATSLVKADIDPQSVERLVEVLGKASLHSEVKNLNEISDAIILMKSVFQSSTPDIERDLSRVIKVSGKFAAEVPDLLNSMKKAGSVYTSSGGAGDMSGLLALATTGRQATRLSGNEMGTSLKSQLQRLYAQPRSQAAANEIGVSMYDKGGQAKKPLQVYNELASAMKNLSDEERNAIATRIFGVYHANKALAILSNMTLANKVYQTALQGGTELEKAAIIAQDSLSVQITKTTESWKSMAVGIASNDAIQSMTKAALNLVSALAQVAPAALAIGALKLGGLGAGSLTSGKGGAYGLPATGSGGYAERYAAFSARGGMGMESPFSRQMRATAGNIGNNLYENRGLVAGAAGIGGLMLSQSMAPSSTSGAIAKTGIESVSAGLLALSLGINPVTAGFIALGVATAKLSSTMLEAEARARAQRVEQAQGDTTKAIAKYGVNDQRVNRALENQLRVLRTEQKSAFRAPGIGESSLAEAGNIVSLNWGRVGSGGSDAQKERISSFQKTAANADETVQKIVQSFVKAQVPMDQWATWSGGIMKKAAEAYDIADDGVANQSRSLYKVVAEQTKEINARKAIADETAKGVEQVKKESEYRKEIADHTQELAKAFGAIAHVGESNKAVAFGKLDIARTQAEFSGREAPRQGAAINEIIKAQATTLSGSSSVDVIAGKLASMIAAQKQLGVSGRGELIAGPIDNAVNSLKLLADSSARTAGYFAELNKAQEAFNSKMNLAVGFFSGDEKEREQMIKDREAAKKAIAQGSLKGLSVQEQQATMRHLGRTENIQGGTFGNEQFTGSQLKEALIKSTIGGAAFAPEEAAKRDAQNNIVNIMKEASTAQQALANFEVQRQADFFNNLSQSNKTFLDSLSRIFGIDVTPSANTIAASGVTPSLALPAITGGATLPQTGPQNTPLANGQMPNVALPPQTGADLMALARNATAGGQQSGINSILDPNNIGAKGPLSGMTWRQLPTMKSTGLEEDRARTRASWIQSQIAKGGDPRQYSRFASQLNIKPEGFEDPSRKAQLNQYLSLRRKGYSEESQVNELKSQGVDFSIMNEAMASYRSGTTEMADSMKAYNAAVSKMSESINRMPTEITFKGEHSVRVMFENSEIFAALEPSITSLVTTMVGTEIDKMMRSIRENGVG